MSETAALPELRLLDATSASAASGEASSRLRRFLLWCAGADPKHLRTATETTRQVGLGSLVCLPPLLAVPASAYALWSHGLPVQAWGPLSLLWGAIVFVFDRFVVTTLPKSGSVARDLVRPSVLLRILLAGGIGVAIAHPLVLLFFDDAIEARLEAERASRVEEVSARQAAARTPWAQALEQLDAERASRDADLRRARDLLTAEIVGEAREDRTTGRLGDGPAAAARRAELEWLEERHRAWTREAEERRAALEARLARGRDEEAAAVSRAEIVRDDLSERSRAVAALVREDSALRTTYWFLLALFVFVDTLPALFKAATPRSLYDELVELERRDVLEIAAARSEVHRDSVRRELRAFRGLESDHVESSRSVFALRLGVEESPSTG